ncbi:plasmid mobilization relaxosome protein MobC [Psychrobacter sp. TWP2-1-2]|uniref:plasmid mobilization relaxosome protein MobC n=1 Tax=Psychrobacter sp. TWP2-1-2 TaxID=2804623 RepID=UPI003CFA1D42
MAKNSYFKLAGLTEDQKLFLKDYATVNTGKRSITAGILTLINESMSESKKIIQAQAKALLPIQEIPRDKQANFKKRVQISLLQHDHDCLENLSNNTDSSIQHYIICMIRNHLYNKHELLGSEIETLRKSNYELYRIGVNVNQIAKQLNAGNQAHFDIQKLSEQISKHTTIVENILKENLNRY